MYPEGPEMDDILVATAARPQGFHFDERLGERQQQMRGFGAWQADLALQRQFHLTEAIALRFRAEFFNIFNHPNFGSPMNVLSSPLFGRSTQMLANSVAGGNNARSTLSIRWAARVRSS
jgi:hypothetical protein